MRTRAAWAYKNKVMDFALSVWCHPYSLHSDRDSCARKRQARSNKPACKLCQFTTFLERTTTSWDSRISGFITHMCKTLLQMYQKQMSGMVAYTYNSSTLTKAGELPLVSSRPNLGYIMSSRPAEIIEWDHLNASTPTKFSHRISEFYNISTFVMLLYTRMYTHVYMSMHKGMYWAYECHPSKMFWWVKNKNHLFPLTLPISTAARYSNHKNCKRHNPKADCQEYPRDGEDRQQP